MKSLNNIVVALALMTSIPSPVQAKQNDVSQGINKQLSPVETTRTPGSLGQKIRTVLIEQISHLEQVKYGEHLSHQFNVDGDSILTITTEKNLEGKINIRIRQDFVSGNPKTRILMQSLWRMYCKWQESLRPKGGAGGDVIKTQEDLRTMNNVEYVYMDCHPDPMFLQPGNDVFVGDFCEQRLGQLPAYPDSLINRWDYYVDFDIVSRLQEVWHFEAAQTFIDLWQKKYSDFGLTEDEFLSKQKAAIQQETLVGAKNALNLPRVSSNLLWQIDTAIKEWIITYEQLKISEKKFSHLLKTALVRDEIRPLMWHPHLFPLIRARVKKNQIPEDILSWSELNDAEKTAWGKYIHELTTKPNVGDNWLINPCVFIDARAKIAAGLCSWDDIGLTEDEFNARETAAIKAWK